MTREQSKEKLWKAHFNGDNPRRAMDSVIDQIYNDHETAIKILMKANEEEISRHFNECEKYEAQLKAKDEEIAKYQIAIDKQIKRAEALKQLSLEKDEDIAIAKSRHKLEHERYLITEAIIKEKDEEIERLKEQTNSVYNLMYQNGYRDAIDCYDTYKHFGIFRYRYKPNAKARSIVAMLFCEWKRDKRLAKESCSSIYYAKAEKAENLFQKAHKMLKDNA